ncbi:hypothetical protein AB9F26_09540 [Falsihalocynthiibacter sp. BN13B15]|uniref:hypothetical protein n=1 Tax=Falsihalocynthiibacter sp. BN13B15 TaxID=3240871 RepID=UPI00350EA51A
MEISELIRMQIESDKKRGFKVEFASDHEREEQLNRETVGLIGEVGEFANLLKKVSLTLTTEGYEGPSLSEASSELREELADAVIYIIRLSTILGGVLENDILEKMEKNDKRYGYLEG